MSVCITTVVDRQYMAYVPIFTWCCHAVYADCDIVLFMRDACPYPQYVPYKALPLFEDFPRFKYESIALRFLVPPEHYAEYDAVYVTDIDMFIMPGRKSLQRFHEEEMVASRLCYSNSLRNVHHYQGSNSLTGLHYATQEWFRQTERERARYCGLFERGLMGHYREEDGVMLYRMAERSGLGLPGKYNLKKRHHGIHAANFDRLFPGSKKAWRDRVPPEYRSQWLYHRGNKIFKEICEQSARDLPVIGKQIALIDEFCQNPGTDACSR